MRRLWEASDWEAYFPAGQQRRTGLRVKFEKGVDIEVKRACLEFAKWLREIYSFPIRVPVYIKSSKHIVFIEPKMKLRRLCEEDDCCCEEEEHKKEKCCDI